MSYSKTTWNSGDVITAEKLNNIESGVEAAGGALITMSHVDGSNLRKLDKTYGEIKAMFEAGITPVHEMKDGDDVVGYYAIYSIDLYDGDRWFIQSSFTSWNFVGGALTDYPIEDLG